MDEDEVFRLLEGHTSTLPELFEPVDSLFAQLRCPQCGGEVEKVVDERHPFIDSQATPNFRARCLTCGCLSTKEGVVIQRGEVKLGANPLEGLSSVDPRNDLSGLPRVRTREPT
jgi:hypothetical protein